jgi:hypothetical protein
MGAAMFIMIILVMLQMSKNIQTEGWTIMLTMFINAEK